MTIIRVTCSGCSEDVRVPHRSVVVRFCVDCVSGGEGTYVFQCPGCGLRCVKEADSRILEQLEKAGCAVVYWAVPMEMRERRPGGEVLNLEDVLVMHELLETEDWFHGLEGGGG